MTQLNKDQLYLFGKGIRSIGARVFESCLGDPGSLSAIENFISNVTNASRILINLSSNTIFRCIVYFRSYFAFDSLKNSTNYETVLCCNDMVNRWCCIHVLQQRSSYRQSKKKKVSRFSVDRSLSRLHSSAISSHATWLYVASKYPARLRQFIINNVRKPLLSRSLVDEITNPSRVARFSPNIRFMYITYSIERHISTFFRNVTMQHERTRACNVSPPRQILPDTPDVRLASQMYLGHIRSCSFVLE